jgi:hypothetical protein
MRGSHVHTGQVPPGIQVACVPACLVPVSSDWLRTTAMLCGSCWQSGLLSIVRLHLQGLSAMGGWPVRMAGASMRTCAHSFWSFGQVCVLFVKLVRFSACKKCMPLCALRMSSRLPRVVVPCCVPHYQHIRTEAPTLCWGVLCPFALGWFALARARAGPRFVLAPSQKNVAVWLSMYVPRTPFETCVFVVCVVVELFQAGLAAVRSARLCFHIPFATLCPAAPCCTGA